MRPYCWFAATLLFLSYVIGLWFTLRTHAAVIWNNEVEEKKQSAAPDANHQQAGQQQYGSGPPGRLQRRSTNASLQESVRGVEIRDSQLYKRILGQSLKHAGLGPRGEDESRQSPMSQASVNGNGNLQTPHQVPPKSSGGESMRPDVHIPGFTEAQNINLVREVAEMAATAATVAARDATRTPRKWSAANPNTTHQHSPATNSSRPGVQRTATMHTLHAHTPDALAAEALAGTAGGHDAPNWSRMKSSIILCGATVLYAAIAEILVNTVDVVLEGVAIDEKFLGITLFALVPNTTEFLVSARDMYKSVYTNKCRTPFHSP